MKKIFGVTLALSAAFTISACSDDSASATDDQPAITSSTDISNAGASSESAIPVSSSTDIGNLPTSSAGVDPLTSSASVDPATSSSAIVLPPEEPCVDNAEVTTVALDTNGFADIGDVFKSIRCNQKAVFVLRHGEREPYVTKESALTEDGVAQAVSVGAKLAGNGNFTYSHTDYVRTEQTCLNIAVGRGQTDFVHDTNDIFQASWFVKDSDKRKAYNEADGYSSNKVLAEWAFTGAFSDAFYDLAERSEEMIATYLQPPAEGMGRFRVVCSHDEFVVPMVTYLTEAAINYRVYDVTIVPKPRWANYLSGFALIYDSDGNRTVYAVKGLDNGFE